MKKKKRGVKPGKKPPLIAAALAVLCLALFVSVNLVSQAANRQYSVHMESAVLDINEVLNAMSGSPDYFEMSRYVNCPYTENLLPADSAKATYGGISTDVYEIEFGCAGDSTGLLIIYEPERGEIAGAFITHSMEV